jgi:hypothetical protein
MARCILTRAEWWRRERARRVCRGAIRRGELVVASACERCGRAGVGRRNSPLGIQAHHPDYDFPLRVEWLCRPCHEVADQERRYEEAVA